MRDDLPGGGPGPEDPRPGAYGRSDDTTRIMGGGEAPRPAAREDWREEPRASRDRDPGAIRAEDTEPYIGLQYVARLFKVVAMVVIVALTAEVVIGVGTEGTEALVPLFAEVIQGGVLAAILWGASDITLLLIDLGHDVRAARVLLGRLTVRAGGDAGPGAQAQRRRDESAERR